MDVDNKIYLTFDMDWACDGVMEFLYDLLEEYDTVATINITNDFSLMEKYRKNEKIDLGIHPNFNSLIDGKRGSDKESVIKQCKEIVPEAVVARSHSLLRSSPLTQVLYSCGIKYELNYFIAPYEGICVYPWMFQGILQVPFFYEDDLYLMDKNNKPPQFYLKENIKMYKIFNFHPIHLFLNSESLARYERIKENYHDFDVLKENVNKDIYGILDFFKDLIKKSKKSGFQFGLISDIERR